MSKSSLPAFLLMLVAATALADEPTERAVATVQDGAEIGRKLAELRARFAGLCRSSGGQAAFVPCAW